jgi:uncharacterized protein (DUF433 family)
MTSATIHLTFIARSLAFRRVATVGRRATMKAGSIAHMSHLDRITSDPEICHGKPTVRGLRYPVETLLELLASGMTTEEILKDYSDLERDDVLAALEFAALALGMRRAMPLGAA